MSDLIINIDFEESEKRNMLIVETYEGIIPNLKSKKYSGQLRNVNINANNEYDNITSINVSQIRDFFNQDTNIQISKYQYILSIEKMVGLDFLLELGCLFYKNRKNEMFQIEKIEYDTIIKKNIYSIDGLQYGGEKTTIYFFIDKNKIPKYIQEIIPKVYVDLTYKPILLNLKFDYGNIIIDFLNKDRYTNSYLKYRDFGFENRIQKLLEECDWKFKKTDGYIYNGKDLNESIMNLIKNGISVYTNSNKKIIKADFSSIRVSYDIDWFSIKGKVIYDSDNIDIKELINFRKNKENWVEYNGKIILIPKALSSKVIEKDTRTGAIYISKKRISSALGLAQDLNGSTVHDLDKLIDYKDISYKIDSSIEKILRAYQLTGVKWLLSLKNNGFGACLADDMGLGKTVQIIAYLSDMSMDKTQNLIIVPKTLIINWKREIEKFSPKISLYVYHGSDRNIKQAEGVKIVISTYQTLVNDRNIFLNSCYDNLIIDEAQYIKNSKSKAYKVLSNMKASMKILLTGTPIENNLSEFLGLMRLINPDILESYSSISKNKGQVVSKVKLLFAPFLLRRLKKDVLKDLPKKQEQTLLVKLGGEQQKVYNKMLQSIRFEILRKNERFEIKSNSIMLKGLLYLQEICCHPQLVSPEYNYGCNESAKLVLLLDLLKTLYSNKHKIVVFSRFTKMLSIIEKHIVSEHMNYYYLDGKTKNRISVVDEFEKSDNGIFLISLKAGGTGINLISADTAIIYDPWWNPASEKQAEDRIYRIGQNKNVIVYKLIAKGTIEEKIQKLQAEKIRLCSEILDGHEIPRSMTIELIKNLLLG